MNNMLTVQEVKSYLDINQDELEKYLKKGRLHAYKIGGTYLRFRKEEVLSLRYEVQPSQTKAKGRHNVFSFISDFWRFNNFYIISFLIALGVLTWMAKTS